MSPHGFEFDWVFGYGSLIWRPAFPHLERRRARLDGWRRSFSQASADHRGTPSHPGRVVTLLADPNAACEGFAFRIDADERDEIVEYLDERESGGYSRYRTTVLLADGAAVDALTYIALPDNPNAAEELALDELTRLVRKRTGPSGSNFDYVVNLADELARHGIADPVVDVLARSLRRHP